MDKLRSMGHHGPSSSLMLDPSKGGLALLQEASTQHSLQQLSYDPSFAERAAKNSTFGNSSYAHQRSSQPGPYSSFDTGRLRDVLETESMHRATGTIRGTIPGTIAGTIPRSASFSSQAYSEDETKPEGAKASTASDGVVTSQENSTGSRGDPQRKRKGSPTKGGTKPACSTVNSDSNKSVEATEQTSLKRQKSDNGIDAKPLKAERSASGNSGDSSPRSLKGGATSKPTHDQIPKQDYIHVRARRGQATDSHSLAERVRREKISERMKFLQDLVPGCSKVTGKAVMLDEIINYVQSLQRQIEFLSMKLAAVNPRLDYNYDQLLGKDGLLLQSRSPETTLLGPDPRGYGDLQHQHCHGQAMAPMHHHMPAACNNLDLGDMRGVESLCDAYLRRSMSVPTMASLLPDDHFSDPLSQAVSLCNGDLQSVVEMGFIQGRQGLGFGTQLNHGSSICLPGKLKVEL